MISGHLGRTSARRLRRRRATAAAIASALAIAVSGAALDDADAAAVAGQHAVHPHIASVSVSHSHLGMSGGKVTVRATAANATRCTLRVRPAVHHPPNGRNCRGGKAHWSVRLPRNAAAAAVHYRFTVSATGSHHHADVRHRTVTVAPTSAPPTITSLTTSRPTRNYLGGRTRLIAHLAHGKTCTVSTLPPLPKTPKRTACTRHKTTVTLHLPANASALPLFYSITLTVTGSHHQQVAQTTSATVHAHPPPCPGQTSTAAPTTSAFFNDPSTGVTTDQTTVVDAEINLICDAQLPSHGVHTRIALAMYLYQLDDVTQALLWAQHYMHASVDVLLDGANELTYAPDGSLEDNGPYDDLVAGLPAGAVLVCGPNAGVAPPPPDNPGDDGAGPFPAGTGCAGDNILHDKLLTVSSVDAAHDPAVFSASQNLTIKAEVAGMNNALQIVGVPALYNLDVNYFTTIAQDVQIPDLGGEFASSMQPMTHGSITSTFFPQNVPAVFPVTDKYDEANDAATDTVSELLKTVNCTAPGLDAGSHVGGTARTTIRLAESQYKKRPLVTDDLEDLAAAGCDVQIVYSTMADKTLADLQAHNIMPVQLNDPAFPYGDGSGTGLVFVHDKYVLISGGLTTGGTTKKDQDVVLAGSANLSQRSLHQNDEQSVEFQQSANRIATPVFDAYAANWDHLAALAAIADQPTVTR